MDMAANEEDRKRLSKQEKEEMGLTGRKVTNVLRIPRPDGGELIIVRYKSEWPKIRVPGRFRLDSTEY